MIIVSPHKVASSRWWRVRFLGTNAGNSEGYGSNYVDIRYIAMFDKVGGTNFVPLNQGIMTSPGIGGANLVLVDDSNISNNQGITQVAVGMWYAFKLPTTDPINLVQVRNHNDGGYTPNAIIVESSYDGATWTFEFGRSQLSWGGATLQSLPRPNIDWGTYAARDWLVRAYKGNGNTNLGIVEMEMASNPGDPDLCEGGTPRSTGNSTYPASNLTDNNTGTLCGSVGFGRNAWVGYTFATPVKVDEVRFNCHGNEQPQVTALIANLGTQGNFDGPWEIKNIVEGVPPLGWGVWHSLDFRRGRPAGATGPHRYWRIRATSPSPGNEMTLWSLTLMEWRDKTGTIISTGGTAIAENSYSGDYPASAPYAGNEWSSAQTAAHTHLWIGYDFGSPVMPASITTRTHSNVGYYNRFPKTINVEWSDDGKMWYAHKGYVTNFTTNLEVATFNL